MAIDFRLEAYVAEGFAPGWRNLTDAIRLPFSLEYGIRSGGPMDRVADTGTLTFTIYNSRARTQNIGGMSSVADGFFSPTKSGHCAGWQIGAPVRLYLVKGGIDYPVFFGWLDAIQPTTGPFGREVVCTAVDWMDWAARLILTADRVGPTQVDVTADQLVGLIFDGITKQPEGEDYDAGSDVYPWAFESARGDTALAELQRIAQSEWGHIYLRAGLLTFRNRLARLSPTSLVTFTDQAPAAGEVNYVSLQIDGSRDSVVNIARATITPRDADTVTGVLFTLGEKRYLAAGEVFTFEADYSDPNDPSERVGGYGMVTPLRNTDFVLNAAQDGSGTDLSHDLFCTAVFGGDSASVTLNNTNAVGGFVTIMQLRGKALRQNETITVEERAGGTSIDDVGEAELEFEMPYQSDANVARAVAGAEVSSRSDAGTTGAALAYIANGAAAEDAALLLGPGDPITVKETMTGLNDLFWINGGRLDYDEHRVPSIVYHLAPGDPTQYWVLGTSALGTDTRLAPA